MGINDDLSKNRHQRYLLMTVHKKTVIKGDGLSKNRH